MLKIKETKEILSFEKGPIRRSLFTNGAVSLFHKIAGRKLACVNLYFLAGSIFETKDNYGIAHVLEHMLFKESKDSNIVRELEFLGAEINAYTSKEYVCFELSCISSKLELFLPKFLNLFLNPSFEISELKLEKNVIIQELKEDKDDHETEAIEYIFKKNFNEEYGHSIGGSRSLVRKFTKEEVLKFYNCYFTSNRMILSVVSGLNFNSLEGICCREFPDTKYRKSYRLKTLKENSKLSHFKAKLDRRMENSILMYSFDGLCLNHKHYYDLLILDELLFEGLSSKFFTILREKMGLIYSLGSSINSYAITGNYIMVFNVSPKNLIQTKKTIKEILNFYCKEFFLTEEVEAIKNRVIEGWQVSFDEAIERCDYIAQEEIYGTNDYSIAKMEIELKKVSKKSLKNMMIRLVKDGFSELVMGK